MTRQTEKIMKKSKSNSKQATPEPRRLRERNARAEDRKKASKPRARRKSHYFGYACKRSFDLRDRLLKGTLTVDDMLDIRWSKKATCPVHQQPCRCQRLGFCWVSDDNGRLALKLFLDHLEGKTLQAFKKLVAENLDRLDMLQELASEHPGLLARVRLIAVFS